MAGVTEVTIRNRYKELAEKLDIDIILGCRRVEQRSSLRARVRAPMPGRAALLLLPLLLAGCASPLNSLDTGRCHAEHRRELDSNGTAWLYMDAGDPPHTSGGARVYTWKLDRAGACVSDLHLHIHAFVATDEPGCATVDWAKTEWEETLALGPDYFTSARPPLSLNQTRGSNVIETLVDQTVPYGPDAKGDEQQEWVLRIRLDVWAVDGALAQQVDDCVRASLRAVDVVATDRDFKF